LSAPVKIPAGEFTRFANRTNEGKDNVDTILTGFEEVVVDDFGLMHLVHHLSI
jgi:hypothetical protein